MVTTARIVKRHAVAAFALLAFLALGSGTSCQTDDENFSEKPALIADAVQLNATIVTPHLQAPIEPNTNVLWCGTFQLAWNEASKLTGGPLRFRDPQPPGADILNREEFTAADLDPDAYVALAGYIRDGIIQRIDQQMAAKFPAMNPSLVPGNEPGNEIVAYSFLFKDLQFRKPFERIGLPMNFAGTNVACFGMGQDRSGHAEMARQISILDYRTPDDFVIELKTNSPADRLILAKIAPAPSLAATIAATLARSDPSDAKPAWPSDVLAVPKMNFDITRKFTEFRGAMLVPAASGRSGGLSVLDAVQNIRFLMNEKGVKLKSESQISFGCSVAPMPEHVMIFDKPFLVLMIHGRSAHTYFACWVANSELLVGTQ